MNKRGSLLADEMGLGKTITTIALIATLRSLHNPNEPTPQILIVSPKTIIFQWKQEIAKWDKLSGGVIGKVAILESTTENKSKVIAKSDLLLTSYEQIRVNIDEFK